MRICIVIFIILTLISAVLNTGNTTIASSHAVQTSSSLVLILVNEVLQPDISNELNLFSQYLSYEGYDVILRAVNSGYKPNEIKDIIKSYYNNCLLTGVILVGNIPAAYTEMHTGNFTNPAAQEVWISLDATDMYYMDLDGNWEHVASPSIPGVIPPYVAAVHLYDSCTTFRNEYIVYFEYSKRWDYSTIANKAQYGAEIWVSRIMGHNLKISDSQQYKSEAQIIKDYLASNRAYRTGQYIVADKAYLLDAINNPVIDHNMDFTGIGCTTVSTGYINKSTFSTYLEDPGGSEVLYLLAHSTPQSHSLKDFNLYVSELIPLKKNSLFYILNTCSACRWDQYISSPTNPNYLGGIYVFSKTHSPGDYGLAAIGFTGVGGFNWLNYLTDYLKNNPNANYGDAFKYFLNGNVSHIFGPSNYVYLGDGTLRYRYALLSPVAGFTAAPNSGTSPLTVTFTDQSTGSIAGRSWSFGDGAASTEQNPSHQYTAAGTYTVSLQVTGPGGSNTMTKNNYITVTPGALHHVTVTPSWVSVVPSTNRQFTAAGYDQYNNPISGLTFNWSIANGGGSIDGNGLFIAGAARGAFIDTVVAESQGAIVKQGKATVAVGTGITVNVTLEGAKRPLEGMNIPFTAKLFNTGTALDSGNILTETPVEAFSTTGGHIAITNSDLNSKTNTLQIGGLPTGAYKLTLFTPGCLVNLKESVTISEGLSLSMGTLLAGNADDYITPVTSNQSQIFGSDFNMLLNDYLQQAGGEKWNNGRCDFDRNGQVTSIDFSLLINNYTLTSPQVIP